MVIIWGLIRIRHKKYAPYIVLLYLFNNVTLVLLQSKNMVPEFMQSKDYNNEEDKIMVIIVAMTAINYNTWRSTFWVFILFLAPM